ncbi:MAG: hypothetical protein ACE5ES_00900 [Candidatus Nanoarchaeia archaeon]
MTKRKLIEEQLKKGDRLMIAMGITLYTVPFICSFVLIMLGYNENDSIMFAIIVAAIVSVPFILLIVKLESEIGELNKRYEFVGKSKEYFDG